MEPFNGMNDYSSNWEWPVAASNQQHAERVAMLQPIHYDMFYDIDTTSGQMSPEPRMARQGKGLSVNVSSGGMLLLMDQQPQVDQALTISVPTPVNMARTPTLAEIRWMRKLPFQTFNGVYFVGLKFLL